MSGCAHRCVYTGTAHTGTQVCRGTDLGLGGAWVCIGMHVCVCKHRDVQCARAQGLMSVGGFAGWLTCRAWVRRTQRSMQMFCMAVQLVLPMSWCPQSLLPKLMLAV